jgi:1,4-dihydroxy-2-naphthoyl-CoA hydrolase
MLNNVCEHTMAVVIGIRFTAIGPDFLQAVMPVDDRTRQPYGLLHGGASAALAETVGSVASSLLIDQAREICVGMELNCNHLRGKTEGIVTATARPLHTGRTTHVWDIRICDEQERLVCISRLTVAIRKRKDK